jgi:hypothetical protein
MRVKEPMRLTAKRDGVKIGYLDPGAFSARMIDVGGFHPALAGVSMTTLKQAGTLTQP